ncbi:MAG: molybdopterin-dependent oxidoreductase, partial [Gemmatimonadota bacterium]|nr:molybdopterin-dependent oxidoreductase [Gemmatimonadota bacterium]
MGADSSIKRLNTLYREDPDEADRLLFGRRTYPDRRGFLKNAGLAAMGALVGAAIPFHRNIPAHFIPVALAAEGVIPGKDGLTVLNDRPMCAETPPHLLDDAITPTERHFVRNNGLMPEDLDASRWTLAIDGLVDHPLTLGLDDLGARFEVVTSALALECAGNGRAFFDPKTKGEQWTYGAVACSEWTGVR